MKNLTKVILGVSILAITNLSANSGENLFNKCKGCHGVNGEKKALGKSQVIKGWEEKKILEALNGYKNGTYGGAMKGIMKGQVMSLKDEEIKALAKYISTK